MTRVVIEQRADSERTRLLAANYSRLHGSDADGTAFADQPVVISSALPTEQPTREPGTENSGSRGPTDKAAPA